MRKAWMEEDKAEYLLLYIQLWARALSSVFVALRGSRWVWARRGPNGRRWRREWTRLSMVWNIPGSITARHSARWCLPTPRSRFGGFLPFLFICLLLLFFALTVSVFPWITIELDASLALLSTGIWLTWPHSHLFKIFTVILCHFHLRNKLQQEKYLLAHSVGFYPSSNVWKKKEKRNFQESLIFPEEWLGDAWIPLLSPRSWTNL